MMQTPQFRRRTRSEIHTSSSKDSREAIQMRKVSYSATSQSKCSDAGSSKGCLREERRVKTESLKNITYNKWFIKPQDRLKRSVLQIAADRTQPQFYYQNLFKAHYPDPECPFNLIANDKLKLFQRIPKANISYIDSFRRNQLAKKKRVPQIIDMLLRQQQLLKARESRQS